MDDFNLPDVKKHGLVTLFVCLLFKKSRSSALDLNTASSFVLNMLYVRASLANYLSSKIEPANGFEINWNFSFLPLALSIVSNTLQSRLQRRTLGLSSMGG